MNTILRLSLCSGVVGAAVWGLGLAQPHGLKKLSAELTHLPALPAHSSEMVNTDLAHEARPARVLKRCEVKQRPVQELIDGQLSLLEAAHAMKQLDEDLPLYPPTHLSTFFPNCSQTECYCRNLIELADWQLGALSTGRARWAAELQSLRNSGARN
jgi:hypothetical protein